MQPVDLHIDECFPASGLKANTDRKFYVNQRLNTISNESFSLKATFIPMIICLFRSGIQAFISLEYFCGGSKIPHVFSWKTR